ncbi:MAG: hypothetical protein PHE53_06670 [Thermoguttaceae bacterium]|nr:hypothetical protein [Thermoguttaceae bacterium]
MQWLWLAAASRRDSTTPDWNASAWHRVPDLYDLVSLDPFLRHLRTTPVNLLIAAAYPEHLLISLLRQSHIPGEYQTAANFLKMTDSLGTLEENSDAEDLISRRIVVWDSRTPLDMEPFTRLCQDCLSAAAMAELPSARAPKQRWYPIVDKTRCAGCMECVNFCLFGVYETGTDGTPKVIQPDACRPGCPACARVCPNQAIFFPYYDDPMISGDMIGEAAESAETTQPTDGAVDADGQPTNPRLAAIRKARAERKEFKKKKAEPETQEESVERWMRELDELES